MSALHFSEVVDFALVRRVQSVEQAGGQEAKQQPGSPDREPPFRMLARIIMSGR
jgi:hypothetical protein